MARQNISIGVCGWGDHHDLYTNGVKAADKLTVYASHFPIVEVDSSFYAILPQKNYQKWVEQTPDRFGFIIKAYQGMTGHQRSKDQGELREWFAQFADSIQPVVAANKLKAILFQFPPWFDCTREHVNYVHMCLHSYRAYPVAVEFRHQSWFTPAFQEKTLSFLRTAGAIHVVCDEPQAGAGSVPIVVAVTQPRLALVRFHGRNTAGWRGSAPGQNWRDVRYLYRYSEAELMEWQPRIRQLAEQAEEVCILFNNNSGGDAVANAKEMMQLLEITPTGLNPQQLELF